MQALQLDEKSKILSISSGSCNTLNYLIEMSIQSEDNILEIRGGTCSNLIILAEKVPDANFYDQKDLTV